MSYSEIDYLSYLGAQFLKPWSTLMEGLLDSDLSIFKFTGWGTWIPEGRFQVLATNLNIFTSSSPLKLFTSMSSKLKKLASFSLVTLFRNITSCFFLIRLDWAEIRFLSLILSLTGILSFLAVLNFALISSIFYYAFSRYLSSGSLFLPRAFLLTGPSELSDSSSIVSFSIFLVALPRLIPYLIFS